MSKQFILICDDEGKKTLEGVLKGIEFLELQGLNLNNENKLNILVTPVLSPVTQAYVQPKIEQPPEIKTDEVENA